MFRTLFSHFYNQVEESYAFVKLLNQKWELFEQKNTYLTSREQLQFDCSSVPHYTKFIHFLLYNIILDEAHKNMLVARDTLLDRLQAQMNRYNDTFVERRLHAYMPLFEDKPQVSFR